MISAQNISRPIMIGATSTTNGATAAGYVDRLGYDYCTINVFMTTSDATSDKPATLRILESDLTTTPSAATNYATITGFVSGTDYTIPSAISSATSITQPFATFNVDCRGRKRYLRVEVSPVTTQIISAHAELSRSEVPVIPANQATVSVIG